MTALPLALAIVIVGFNTRHDLSNLVRDLCGPAPPELCPHRIIVVDNGSQDGSVDMIRKKHPGVDVIAAGRNLGFPAANNVGIESVPAANYLLLNPDTRVSWDAIARLVFAASNAHRCGLAGPRLLNEDGSTQVSCFRDPSLYNIVGDSLRVTRLPIVRRFMPARGYVPAVQSDATDVPVLLGAAVLITRACIEGVGLLDPNYFWMEFSDYCLRARRAGFRSYYVPDAVLTHLGGTAKRRFPSLAALAYLTSERRYFREHRSKTSARVIMGWRLAGLGTKAAMARAQSALGDRLAGQRSRTLQTLMAEYCSRDGSWERLT